MLYSLSTIDLNELCQGALRQYVKDGLMPLPVTVYWDGRRAYVQKNAIVMRDQLVNYVAIHFGQTEIPSLIPVGQPRVVEAEPVQKSGVQVLNRD